MFCFSRVNVYFHMLGRPIKVGSVIYEGWNRRGIEVWLNWSDQANSLSYRCFVSANFVNQVLQTFSLHSGWSTCMLQFWRRRALDLAIQSWSSLLLIPTSVCNDLAFLSLLLGLTFISNVYTYKDITFFVLFMWSNNEENTLYLFDMGNMCI